MRRQFRLISTAPMCSAQNSSYIETTPPGRVRAFSALIAAMKHVHSLDVRSFAFLRMRVLKVPGRVGAAI